MRLRMHAVTVRLVHYGLGPTSLRKPQDVWLAKKTNFRAHSTSALDEFLHQIEINLDKDKETARSERRQVLMFRHVTYWLLTITSCVTTMEELVELRAGFHPCRLEEAPFLCKVVRVLYSCILLGISVMILSHDASEIGIAKICLSSSWSLSYYTDSSGICLLSQNLGLFGECFGMWHASSFLL
jgi:hypothetical protein